MSRRYGSRVLAAAGKEVGRRLHCSVPWKRSTFIILECRVEMLAVSKAQMQEPLVEMQQLNEVHSL